MWCDCEGVAGFAGDVGPAIFGYLCEKAYFGSVGSWIDAWSHFESLR